MTKAGIKDWQRKDQFLPAETTDYSKKMTF